MNEPRFIVSSVAGFRINTDVGIAGQTKSAPPVSFYVLDRAYCHRVVAAYDSDDPHFNRLRGASIARKQLAEAKAAELNAWDATL